MSQDRVIGCLLLARLRGKQGRLEPAAVLVRAFEIEVGREA